MGGLGTALTQATWADRTEAARFLIERGARVNQAGPRDDMRRCTGPLRASNKALPL